MIRVSWDIEELVALEWVCLRSKEMTSAELSDELKHLSAALNRRADAIGIEHDKKFRNYNGMKLCYQNMTYILTDGKKGLPNANRNMYDVYDLWKNDHSQYMAILEGFIEKYW